MPTPPDWLHPQPVRRAQPSELDAFLESWTRGEPYAMRGPRWEYLDHLAANGYLLHGSQDPGITVLEPRTPADHSPDDFSKRAALFATSNALWAISWALRGPKVRGTMNTCIQVRVATAWTDWLHYFAVAPVDGEHHGPGADLLSPGVVYAIPRGDAEVMPPYDWPGVGLVREPQYARGSPAPVVGHVPVEPSDYLLPVATFDMDRILALSASDPWGFPWP